MQSIQRATCDMTYDKSVLGIRTDYAKDRINVFPGFWLDEGSSVLFEAELIGRSDFLEGRTEIPILFDGQYQLTSSWWKGWIDQRDKSEMERCDECIENCCNRHPAWYPF